MSPYSHLTCWKCRRLKPVNQFKRSVCGKYPTDLCLDCMTNGANLATVVKDETPKYEFKNYTERDYPCPQSYIRTLFIKGRF